MCLTSSCVHFSRFLKYVFRIHVNCKRTCKPVPPLLHSRRSPNHFGMEFASNNLRLHVSTVGDILATLRFARFHAAPNYKLRPQTLQSAPGPFAEQCSLFGPNGKMFGVSFWASASTQNLATRAFDINSLNSTSCAAIQ